MVFDDTRLKALYSRYGYIQFRMSKFEEYELYVRNKDFLDSLNVITFTDTNGKLMALKPDVTLSIVKNSKDTPGEVRKVFYNENVYRVSKRTGSFQELMQVGLECVGDVDEYNIYEVIMLAAESLMDISENCVLDISHLGIINDILNSCDVDYNTRGKILICISEKNAHGIRRICEENNIPEKKAEILCRLVYIYGRPEDVIPRLEKLLAGEEAKESIEQLKRIAEAFDGNQLREILRLDFSVTNDIGYYNDIVFIGFVQGVPDKILSGGQYDKVMLKMGLKSRAIGFAINTNALERINASDDIYDVDTLLIYENNADIIDVKDAVEELTKDGGRVLAQRNIPDKIKYRQLIKLQNGEVKTIESDD